MSLLMDALKKAEKAKQDSKIPASETTKETASNNPPVPENAPSAATDIHSAEPATPQTTPAVPSITATEATALPSTHESTQAPDLIWDWHDELVLIEEPNPTSDITNPTASNASQRINWDEELLPEFHPPKETHEITESQPYLDSEPNAEAMPVSTTVENDSHSIDWDEALITDYHQQANLDSTQAKMASSPSPPTTDSEEVVTFMPDLSENTELDAFSEDSLQDSLFLDLTDINSDTGAETEADPMQAVEVADSPPTLVMPDFSLATSKEQAETTVTTTQVTSVTTADEPADSTAAPQPIEIPPSFAEAASPNPPLPALVMPDLSSSSPVDKTTTPPPTQAGLAWGFDVKAEQTPKASDAPPMNQTSPAATPQAAQRVLHANKTGNQTLLLGGIITGIVLLLLVLGLGGSWYYYQTELSNKPIFTTAPPPNAERFKRVADNTAGTEVAAVDTVVAPAMDTASLDALNELPVADESMEWLPQLENAVNIEEVVDSSIETLPTIGHQPIHNSSNALSPDKSSQSSEAATQANAPPPDAPAIKEPISIGTLPTAQSAIVTEASEPVAESTSIGLKSVQKTENRKASLQLRTAYQAFQRGNDSTAQRIYQQIYHQQPTNRDALLGLAALAIRQGQIQQAVHYYQEILRLYPQDGHAQAGLISLQGQLATPSNERQLKALLEQSPNADYLHFSLGNLYASQNRWHEAQQAFFQAYHHAQNQADYAYNLAVSLEHIDQPGPALQYYQRAAQLASTQVISFDRARLQQRVQQLSQRVQVQSGGIYRSAVP